MTSIVRAIRLKQSLWDEYKYYAAKNNLLGTLDRPNVSQVIRNQMADFVKKMREVHGDEYREKINEAC